ncbi:hypothetical protein HHL23_19815 [Chryseobacterium sp. RP-3-3]|uniref:GWxTD domain-containing protein n=1 Tax=Chryseobacterium antibioticum TaxID=2728847 RepID=A0A7Y0ARA5_9FLAO|nr:hypothetical protein [Chryseobacterium antibioticum]NML72023.1 hypothetical protein [Chryseobacterium antibioticum]
MNFFKISKALFIFLFLFAFQMTLAQGETSEIPQWIKMMDDPNASYYQTVKSFEDYWKDREKPVEENEIFRDKEAKIRKYKNKETPKYAFEYKKFMNWRKKTFPFVQDDGRILTKDERMEIWEKERRNRNKN